MNVLIFVLKINSTFNFFKYANIYFERDQFFLILKNRLPKKKFPYPLFYLNSHPFILPTLFFIKMPR